MVSLSVSKNAKWLAVGTACNSILIISTQTASVIATLPALGSQHTDIQFHPNKSWLGNPVLSFVLNLCTVIIIVVRTLWAYHMKVFLQFTIRFTSMIF